MKKNVLVIGANGQQGGIVADYLLKQGYNVKVFVTSSKSFGKFTAKGAIPVLGNLEDVASLENALQDVEYLCLTFPTTFDKQRLIGYTTNVIEAAKRSKLKLIVYNTSAWYPDEESDVWVHQLKQEKERLLRESGLPLIILRPTLYLENMTGPWSLPLIVNNGTFAYPILSAQKIAWTSHADLAKFTAAALERETLKGQRFDIGSVFMSGDEIASKLSVKLGRTINFVSIPAEEFQKQLTPIFGEDAEKIAGAYAYTQAYPEKFAEWNTKEKARSIMDVRTLSLEEWADTITWSVPAEQVG